MKLAIVGLDSTHTDFFCKSLQKSCYKVDLYFYDLNEDLMDKRCEEYGGTKINTAILGEEQEFDLVMIVSRFGDEHFSYFLQFHKNTKFLFIDKPLTLESEQAKKIHDLAMSQGVYIRSHTPLVYSKEYSQAKKILTTEEQVSKVNITGPLYCRDLQGDKRFLSVFFYGIHACEIFLSLADPDYDNFHYTIDKIETENVVVRVVSKNIEFTFNLIDSIEEQYNININSSNEQLYSEDIILDGSYYPTELNSILDTKSWKNQITDAFIVSLRSVEMLEEIESLLRD